MAKEINSVTIKGHPEIKWQLDDLNDDGHADELVFLVDLKPNATETYKIDLSSEPADKKFEAGTYAYIRLNDKTKASEDTGYRFSRRCRQPPDV